MKNYWFLLLITIIVVVFFGWHVVPAKKKYSSFITIGFLGDVMVGRGVNEELKNKPIESIWGNLLPILRGTTVNIANLETAVTLHDKPVPKVFNFKTDPKNVAALLKANIKIVNLANNHTLDFGVPGLEETLKTLHAAGIKTVGAGQSLSQAREPVIVSYNDISLGIISFTDNEPTWLATDTKPGINYAALNAIDSVIEQIKQLRPNVDILIISAHWGGNWPSEPTPEMQKAAHQLIDAGADIIHGHSAHITLGVELYKNSLIMYSTGDFVDDYAIDPEQRNDQSFIYEVTVAKKGVESLRLIPVILTYAQTNKASKIEGKKMLERAAQQAAALGTKLTNEGKWRRSSLD